MSTDQTADRPADPTADAADRVAAAALLVASLAGLAVMALHPTGRDAVQNAAAGVANTRMTAVHTVALLVQPLVLAGTLALTRRLRAGRAGGVGAVAVGATVYFTLASAAAVVAAAASGFVAPGVLRGFAEADAPTRATMLTALEYTGRLNRAFARIDVLFTGGALLLWSGAMLADRTWPRALAGYGLLLGAALAVGAGGGHLRFDVHGFGLVVLGQAVWNAGVAARLWGRRRASRPVDRSHAGT